MKKLNCNLYGLSELTENEKSDTEGGVFIFREAAALTGWGIGITYKYFIALPIYFFTSLGIGAY